MDTYGDVAGEVLVLVGAVLVVVVVDDLGHRRAGMKVFKLQAL